LVAKITGGGLRLKGVIGWVKDPWTSQEGDDRALVNWVRPSRDVFVLARWKTRGVFCIATQIRTGGRGGTSGPWEKEKTQ